MKIKKLNSVGVAHEFLLVAFVVIFAVAGVGYLVATNANSCGPSGCNSVSGAVSGQAGKSGSCKISNVPTRPAYGQVITPYVTVKNTGKKSFTPNMSITYALSDSRGLAVGEPYNQNLRHGKLAEILKPKKSVKVNSLMYTVDRKATPEISKVQVLFNNTDPNFYCKKIFNLPKK